MESSYRRRKLTACLWIMGGGMLVAILWHGYQWLILGSRYPYNTFLFLSSVRFTDYTDTLATAILPNPYVSPDIPYLPFTWVVLRPVALAAADTSFIFFLFFSLGGLALLLSRVLAPIIPNPWARVGATYLLLGCGYPVLFCADRGNIELFLILLVAGALYYMGRARYFTAMLWLLPAICFKLYPALLLVFLVRQRKLRLTIGVLVAFVVITFASLGILSLSPQIVWHLYQRNMAYFSDFYVYENHSLEGAASIWNAIKVSLILAGQQGLIAPIDFTYDSTFVHHAFAMYSAGMIFLVTTLALFAGVLEKEFQRGAAMLLLFFALGSPAGGDYRLIYAGMALVILVLATNRRRYDWWVLVLLALTMVPKKEIILGFAGRTESDYRDVSAQVVLNPLLVSVAILLLLIDSWRQRDLRWVRLRVYQWKNSVLGFVLPRRLSRRNAT